MSADVFYAPAEHAFDHPELEVEVEAGPSSMGDANLDVSIEKAYEVSETVDIILKGGYKTIGLQFPDELLSSAVYVYRAIQRGIGSVGAQSYVLADSTYGRTDAIPVHYVFPRRSLDATAALKSLLGASKEEMEGEEAKKAVIVVWDVAFDWVADEIIKTFTAGLALPVSFAAIQRPKFSSVSLSDREREKSPALRSIVPPPGVEVGECIIWYLGEEGRGLLNIQMTHVGNPLFSYSPETDCTTAQHPRSSKLLSKRLFALHSAMNADVFGLVVGNVGLASSKPLLDQLRKDLKREKKKSYTLSVGRLNPSKLANLAEIECFVLIGCNEGGVVDSKDFFRPIITPWELTLALQGSKHVWDPTKWTLDLSAVLADAKERGLVEKEKVKEEDEELEFSLVTGAYRSRKTYGNGDESPAVIDGVKDLTIRNKEFTLAKLESAGSNYLSSRSFQGLDPRYGLDEPSSLEEGRTGIARGYTEEK
ncbi:diphthamide biosynthesis protein 2, partial [Tremellales sp. Uapishka_1]